MITKKVGIITFHRALNYGAVLQAYALKAVCDAAGYDTQIVDYRFNGIKDEVKPFSRFLSSKNKKRALIRLALEIAGFAGGKKREKEFGDFRAKYLNESIVCKNADDIRALNCDYLIAGSDQIWNYKITDGNFDPVFFLDIDTKATKIIYAASSHDVPFPLNMEIKLKEYLLRSNAHIGIREKQLADYVAEISGVKYPVVIDPTLLAGKNIMSNIPTLPINKKPYILLYQIDSNPNSDISIKTLKKCFGYDVYSMNVPRIGKFKGRKGSCGPEKFLSLLKGAEFLVTNSFHGIALSLIFEKQFYVYENGGVMSRIDGLLSQVGLLGRKVQMIKDIKLDDKIDYELVTPVLTELQIDSRRFLKEAFAGEMIKKSLYKNTPPVRSNVGLRDKSNCCGCSSCQEICPLNAIEMQKDEEGFLYPQINEKLCVNCGKCENACGFNKQSRKDTLPKAYGIKHLDRKTRESSRSGGAFVAFSDVILQNGGSVYGAVMQSDFSVKHMRATNVAERDAMKKAKYVQSNTIGIYGEIKNDLNNSLPVLFSGTPCQVAGLKAYLKECRTNTEKLVCCDMVCHGVPSPLVWKDYLSYLTKKYDDTIVEAQFRDKSFGWDSHCESFVLEKKNKKIAARDYTDLFYQHIMFRPSCHNCQFANVNRPGDITLADFWGIEKHCVGFNDNRGVSLVLINSQKGNEVFAEAKGSFECFECKVEDCMQPTLYKASAPSYRRSQFWRDYNEMPFDRVIKKYTVPKSLKGKLKKVIKLSLYRIGIRKHP